MKTKLSTLLLAFGLAILFAPQVVGEILPPPVSPGTVNIEVTTDNETRNVQHDYVPPVVGSPYVIFAETIGEPSGGGGGARYPRTIITAVEAPAVAGETTETFNYDSNYAIKHPEVVRPSAGWGVTMFNWDSYNYYQYSKITKKIIWDSQGRATYDLWAMRLGGKTPARIMGQGLGARIMADGPSFFGAMNNAEYVTSVSGDVGQFEWNGSTHRVWRYLPGLEDYFYRTQADGTTAVFKLSHYVDEVAGIHSYYPIGELTSEGTPGHGGEVRYEYRIEPLDPSVTYTSLKSESASFTEPGNFQIVTDPTASYQFSPAEASAIKLRYKLGIQPGIARTITWAETFTPDSASAPTDYRFMSEPVAADATETSAFIIDPFDTANPHRFGPVSGTYRILTFEAALTVDANRDGVILPAVSPITPYLIAKADTTTAEHPYRFWINDDIDKLHTFDDSAADSMATVGETEEDDIGPAEASQFSWQADYIDGRIESKRDLEDFSRLWIHTQGLNAAFKSGELKLGLKWTDAGSTTPAIKFYESVEADGGLGYLTNDAIAANQLLLKRNAITLINAATGYAATQISGSETFVLPTSLFANLSETQPKTYLLFEGCAVGKGQLKLVILKLGSGSTYTEIGEGPGVWLDLKKVGDMYEHWSVGNASGGDPDDVAARIPSLAGGPAAFKYDEGSPSSEERKYILYVHGWNMERWEKERFAETAYKRLWWQGYKGRFGLFSWPTTNGFGGGGSGVWGTIKSINGGVNDGTNFDRGEFSAWLSGAPLRQLMQTLSSAYDGKLYVFSHSMGGIVASEALRLQSDANGEQIANVYVASQAALSAHAYDGTLSEEAGSANALQWHYDHPRVPGGEQDFGPQTPNIYKNWMAFVLGGSATSTKAVGTLVNFYNANDWALAAPAWQFNQLTKPDWPDGTLQPWRYAYAGDPETFNDVFEKTEGDFGSNLTPLHLGTRGNPQDRYEIMAFAAESRVKAFGATSSLGQGVTNLVDLRLLEGWSTDNGGNKAHKWHSGQFRSSIQQQKSYWKTLLGTPGFNILTGVLP